MPATMKGQGGKLTRSEILQTRLTPKLRLAAEILARKQRRTVSSLLEVLVEEAAKNEKVLFQAPVKFQEQTFYPHTADFQEVMLEQAIEGMWQPTEAERFVALAMSMSSFLNEQEEVLWQLIKSTAYFWEHFQVQVKDNQDKVIKEDRWPAISYKGLIREHLQQYWRLLNEIAVGKKPLSELTVLNVSPAKQTTVTENKMNSILVKQII